MFNVKAIYSEDYGNQSEGVFFEDIGKYSTIEEAQKSSDNFELQVRSSNFLRCIIDEVK
jgi:hypothetical protein